MYNKNHIKLFKSYYLPKLFYQRKSGNIENREITLTPTQKTDFYDKVITSTASNVI